MLPGDIGDCHVAVIVPGFQAQAEAGRTKRAAATAAQMRGRIVISKNWDEPYIGILTSRIVDVTELTNRCAV